MGRNTGLFGAMTSIDAFGKTMEDVKIRTRTGAFLTMLSLAIIVTCTFIEFVDYRKIHIEPSILVDKSRGEKLTVDMDITFPRVPCYLLSIDIMDISGEHQNDLTHNINKTRLNDKGEVIDLHGTGLTGDLEKMAATVGSNYCGDCYGGTPPSSGCCNSCEDVRESYVRKGWSFTNPDGIEQCVKEHWSEKIEAQNKEGCNVAGRVRVNKVVGNFHMSPGRSYQLNSHHTHDLVPYLRSGNHHDFGHVIHKFSFGADDAPLVPTQRMLEVRKKLKVVNPLEGVNAHTEESNYMFQYFLKVVSTKFESLKGEITPAHQYSVTSYERDMSGGGGAAKDSTGHMTAHGMAGVPGVFFNYEISPMLVVHQETRQSFAHFLTSTMAIIGGVLTLFQIVDSLIFTGKKKLKGEKDSDGYGGLGGKLI
ncbi:COPII vesicle protein [Phaffia rhodozyma]|uniref:COPII vesicle protein n=1 Tax=Phaffia rhodozyma TaxID=264483 RepID=A0A0F7SHF2_PHARH|nr:COPII vesicle protein [Phaffia rhodozyma]